MTEECSYAFRRCNCAMTGQDEMTVLPGITMAKSMPELLKRFQRGNREEKKMSDKEERILQFCATDIKVCPDLALVRTQEPPPPSPPPPLVPKPRSSPTPSRP